MARALRRPVHYRIHGRPLCRPNADVARTLPSNTTYAHPEDVTCRACRQIMAKVADRLTPKKSKR